MLFDVNIPVKIISGENCITKNCEQLLLGKRAFIVTGKNSAKICGALDDVTWVLDRVIAKHTIFNEITENPPIRTCFNGGVLCEKIKADFIIAIGGGSVIDAAKAIATYATNIKTIKDPIDIFDNSLIPNAPLPLVAIPTTAGTGSEANAYSVLTLEGGDKKRTFKTDSSWAKIAFLDPKYTKTLSQNYTISTALDAFSHALESYLSPKSTHFSEIMALYAARNLWRILPHSHEGEYTIAERASLQNAACAAGIAISITGTGFPHPLGYSLTLLDGIPHGRACAVFDADYIEYNLKNEDGKIKLQNFCAEINEEPLKLKRKLLSLCGVSLKFTKDQIERRIELIKDAKNFTNSPYVININDIYAIYNKLFMEEK